MIPVASPALNKEPGTKWMLKEYLLDLHLSKRLVGSCKFQSQDKSTEDSKARLAVKTATFQFLSKTTLGFNISGNCVILEQNDFTHISTREHQGIDLWNIRSLSKWQDQNGYNVNIYLMGWLKLFQETKNIKPFVLNKQTMQWGYLLILSRCILPAYKSCYLLILFMSLACLHGVVGTILNTA